jgi:hypothetical protein
MDGVVVVAPHSRPRMADDGDQAAMVEVPERSAGYDDMHTIHRSSATQLIVATMPWHWHWRTGSAGALTSSPGLTDMLQPLDRAGFGALNAE